MRRLFIPACILTALCLIAFLASFFHAEWISPNYSTRIILHRASLRLWLGAKDDWIAFKRPYGLDVRSWSGHQPRWTPSIDTDARLYVQALPFTQPNTVTSVPAKQIRGVEIVIPWYLPLLAMAGASTLLYFPWRRHRRARVGHCKACGYDLTGLARCPECGLSRLVAVLRALLRPA